MKKQIIGCLLLVFPILIFGQVRNKQTINECWKFFKGDNNDASSEAFDDKAWKTVTIPHTWNIEDIQDEIYGWYRGVGWYRKSLNIDKLTEGRRLILWFEAANQVSEVFVNGRSAGEKHIGGYTPFSYDITDLVKQNDRNVIAVKVDNAHNKDIPPLSADFVFYGGIYRDVHLIETNAVRFDLLNQGNGVYITTPEVSQSKATVAVRADLNNYVGKGTYEIVHTVLDAGRNPVTTVKQKVNLKENGNNSFQAGSIKIDQPNLWSPDSPYLYSVVSEIKDLRGNVTDRIENPLGLRTFSFDPKEGFFLNGNPLKLMGTNRHQDYINYGNALTDDMHRYDLKMMKELGINCFRISHYPQDPAVLEMADRYGFICFEEIPIINYLTRTPEYLQNSKSQISEMIRKDHNHPCIVAWNQSNESALSRPDGLRDDEFEAYSVDLAEFYKNLKEHIRKEDPTRYAMIVHNSGVADHFKRGYHQGDIVGYNLYLGWYEQEIDDIYAYFESMPKINPDASWFISEYGAGSDPRIRTFDPIPWDHSVEYQLKFNKVYQKAIMKYPFIAGGTVWNFNDFYSEGRREVQPHLNNKGLVTSDRRKKDSYYFFQAAWSKKPVANIGSKLWTDRAGEESAPGSGSCIQPIEIYANTSEVELFLNNISLGRKSVKDFVASWDVPFKNGENIIELRAEKDDVKIVDFLRIDFNVIPADLKSKELPFSEIAVNAGSNCYFIDDLKNNYLWMPDKRYQKGSYGYTEGEPFVRDKVRGYLGCVDNIEGTVNEPVYQTQLLDPRYRFDVPKGNYEVTLLFSDLNNGNEDRIFDVAINENIVLKNLNLSAEYGKFKAISKRFEINVDNEEGIDISFPAKSGQSILNGIIVRKIYN